MLLSGARIAPGKLRCFPQRGYLVGGAVRDILLGESPADFDYLTENPREDASACALSCNGTAFLLDESRNQWRALCPGFSYDFSPLGDLQEDLLSRDYSVNSLAVNRQGVVMGPAIAFHDLPKRTLRALCKANLQQDLLRPLRGWRLWSLSSLRPEPRTLSWIAELAASQRFGAQPAAERVRIELEKVISSQRAAWGFRKLLDLGFAAAYLREWSAGAGVQQYGYHHLDVANHQLETLFQLLRLFPGAGLALRWAALLHDIAKPLVRQYDASRGYFRFFNHAEDGSQIAALVLGRLRQPKRLIARVRRLILWHMDTPPTSKRGLKRWLYRRRAMIPELIMLQLADRAASRGELAKGLASELQRLHSVLKLARASQSKEGAPLLLSGRDIMKILGIEPGPLVGRLKDLLAQAQALDEVTERGAAVNYVKYLYDSGLTET